MNTPRSLFRFLALAIVLGLLAPPRAHAETPVYEAFYAFGDSLADNGNDFLTTKALRANPAVPPSSRPTAPTSRDGSRTATWRSNISGK